MFFSSIVTVLLSFLLRLKIIHAGNEGKILKEIHENMLGGGWWKVQCWNFRTIYGG
jgi:hypothetical protein